MFNSQIKLGKEYLTPEYFPPETAPLSLSHHSKAGIEVASKSICFQTPKVYVLSRTTSICKEEALFFSTPEQIWASSSGIFIYSSDRNYGQYFI